MSEAATTSSDIISTNDNMKSKISSERKLELMKIFRSAIRKAAAERKKLFTKNATYSALCIKDAFQGRLSNGLANNSKKDWFTYTIFCIQTNALFLKAIVFACFLHTLSVFIFNESGDTCSNSTLYYIFQICVMALYVFDISLKMSYEGLHEYLDHDWQVVYLSVVAISCLDLFFDPCTFYSNPLRPVVGVLRARTGRQFFIVLKKMIPEMTHSLVPLLFFVVMVVVAWCLLFDSHIAEFTSTSFTSYNWFFLVFTNDTFTRILPSHLSSNAMYLIFFFPCIYVGQRFLLSIIIGDTYESYKGLVKKQLKKEKLKEMQGLVKAFAALDFDKSGSISKHVWKEALNQYDPSIPDEAIALYFELIAQGGDVVNVLQFLSLRRVLNFNLTLRSTKSSIFSISYFEQKYKEISTLLSDFDKKLKVPVPSSWSKVAQHILKLIEGKASYHLVSKMCAIDIYILCCGLNDFTLFTLSNGTMQFNIGDIFHLSYILEFFTRLVACEGRLADTQKNNNFTSAAFVVGVISMFLLRMLSFFRIFSNEDIFFNLSFQQNIPFVIQNVDINASLSYYKLFLLSYALRCVRIRNLNKTLLSFSMAIIDVLPTLIETFGFTLIICYITGVFGHILFGNYMEEWKTPLLGIVKAQQLSYMVDFLDSTEEAMEKVHPAACIFFVCYLLLSLTVSNIALSIIIEVQNNMLQGKTSSDRDSEKAKLELVFEQIKQQARQRASVGNEGYDMNFSNIQMSQFQSSDTRHFIADMDGENSLKLEDLKKCQKYASVNLTEYHQLHSRMSKDLNWEVDFVHSLEEESIGSKKTYQYDEILFSADEPANFLYIVIKGSIYLQEQVTNRLANISATNVVGGECLNAKGTYLYTCTAADNDTVCLSISKDDLENKISTNMCGSVLRLCFKANMVILNQFNAKSSKKRGSLTYSESVAFTRAGSISVDGNNSRSQTPALPISSNSTTENPVAKSNTQHNDSVPINNFESMSGVTDSPLKATTSAFINTRNTPATSDQMAVVRQDGMNDILKSDLFRQNSISLGNVFAPIAATEESSLNGDLGTPEDDTTSELTSPVTEVILPLQNNKQMRVNAKQNSTGSAGLTSISSDDDVDAVK